MATRQSARQAARRQSRRSPREQSGAHKPLYRRTLRYEPLEDRRLLALVTVDTPLDIVDIDDGLTSLREAIFATNLVSGPDEITFDFGHDGPETILLTMGELRITDDLTITGPGASLLTIDASGNDPTPDRKEGFGSRILNINDGNSAHLLDVVINGLVLTGGDMRGDGGAIVSNEHLTILYCTISQNWTSGDGGAIYSERGNLTISGSTITANSAVDHGGGVSHIGDFSIARTVTVIDSTINGNSAMLFDGGGINVENASVVLQGSTVSGNSARWEGGAIYIRNRFNFPSRLEITESTISGNTTESRGGGGISSSGINGNNLHLIVSASVISGNSVGGRDGGGILSRYCDLTVSNSSITGNSAKFDGGGISARWGDVDVTSSTISGNSAQHDGGGLYGHYINVTDTTISGNSAVGRGGGIFVGFDLTLSQSTVSDNSSGGDGGGIEGQPAFLKLVESTVSGNTSKRNGGGVNSSLITAIENSTISGNSASRSGGGIYSRGLLTLMHCIVEGNSAIDDGGGIATFGTGGSTSITDTSIIGNSAALGGGIHSQDKGLTLTAVTMSGNSARGNGGGILSLGPELFLTNSTISGNMAEGAGAGLYLLNRGSSVFAIDHSTIVSNSATGIGGGIVVVGSGLQLNHSIVARNEAIFGPDLMPLFGSADVRFSLIGRNSQSELAEAPLGLPDANGNLVGGLVHGAIDPLLGPLADNGGRTFTHALLPGSPAINAGDLNAKAGEGGVPLYDQRGEPFGRVVNGRIDVGAFEYQEPSDLNLLVDTLEDESDGNFGRGDLSLREAIALANLYPSDDTIRFDPALTAAGPATILLTMGGLLITDDLTIEGPGAEFLTIDASGNDPTPTVNDGRGSPVFVTRLGSPSVSIRGLTLTGGDSRTAGGAISAAGNLTVADCIIVDNAAGGFGNDGGGGIDSPRQSLTVVRTIISGNSARGDGGGIRKNGGVLIIEDSTISDNATDGIGGGIFADGLPQPVQLHIRNSTIRNNSAHRSLGGGLSLLGGVGESTIEGTTITGNSAGDGGGIWSGLANLTVVASTISGNSASAWGGGIMSSSVLKLVDSVVSGNSAAVGGGIAVEGHYDLPKSLSLIDSTISDNLATLDGGGIFSNRANVTAIGSTINNNQSERIGGGIAFRDPSREGEAAISLSQSTISGNRSKQHGGGIYVDGHPDSQHTISHSTIAFNASDADSSGSGSGGGLFVKSGNVQLDHTIAAGNHDNTVVAPDVAGIIHGEFSLIGFGSAFLGPLANNGGPTMTHALLPGSPAINAGDLNAKSGVDGVPLYDQRGEPFGRVVNGRIDIGAFEYQAPSDLNLVVDTLADESDGNHGRGDLSLREAIELANLYPSDDTIRFDPAITAAGPATILLTMGELRITDDVSIEGPGADQLTIDASGNDPTPDQNNGDGSRIFNINQGQGRLIDVSIAGLTLTGGDTATDGGAVLSIGRVAILDSIISGNSSVRNGGGIFGRGDLVVEGTIISHNSGRFGGGLYGNTRTLTLTVCTIVNNLAEFRGGGIYTSRAITVADSTISHNSAAAGLGGGIHAGAAITITRSAISYNSAAFGGGGIFMNFGFTGNTTLTNSTMSGNSTGGSGGGILSGDAVTLTNSTISGSSAGESGGAVEARRVTLLNSVVSGNTAEYRGGGVHANSSFMATDSVVARNSAQFGGGVYTSTATMTRCTISDNSATGFGGGGIRAGTVTITNSTISGNSAIGGMGGGIRMQGGTIASSTISGNSAVVGGGVYSYSGSFQVDHSTIALNTAAIGGGVFIASGTLAINHTILAANRALTAFDVQGVIGTSATARYSFIGDGALLFARTPIGSPDANGNIVGGNPGYGPYTPRLAPLADNGGPTKTHALFADSLAINAGDPAAMAGVGGVPQFDQRGEAFTRVHGGRIDIGAFESQPNPLTGDYNLSGVVDAADAVVWRKTHGSTTDLRADGNGDGIVNEDDWQVWRTNFGRTGGSAGQGAESGAQGARSGEQEAVDALPQRPAWQPPASPGVSLATSRAAFRPLSQRFASDRELLASLASPRATSAGRRDFIPAPRQLLCDTDFDFDDPSEDAVDQVFETLGENTASRPS